MNDIKSKKNAGFTLIELMGAITILVILSLIIVPIIDKNVKKSKDNMFNVQIDNIRIAGMNYFSDNEHKKPRSGAYSFVKLSELIEDGYIKADIKNPKTGRPFDEDIYVQILNYYGDLSYKVCPIEEDCEDYVPGGGYLTGIVKVKDVNPGVICGSLETEDYDNNEVCYIYSVEDLVEFSNMVNNGYTFQNKIVMLMNSLDVTNNKSYVDSNFTGFGDVNGDSSVSPLIEELTLQTTKGFPVIGNNNNYFNGTFEGNGKKIINLYINSSDSYAGFFGYNAGTIRGLIFEGSIVKGASDTGGVVGYNAGNISNIVFSGNVSGGTRVGLISGYSRYGEIYDVVADGHVRGSSYVGGLVGAIDYGMLKGIYRSGSITSTSNNYVNKCVGNYYGATLSVISLSSISITANGSVSTPTNNYIVGTTGYTVDEEAINSIGINEAILDTYIGSDNNNDGYYFDYDSTGKITLYNIDTDKLVFNLKGKGTVDNPYIINNLDELKQASYNPSAHYKLNADIDLDGVNYIMLSSYNNQFTGSFDGNFHSIDNFRIIGHEYTGLFGYSNGGNVSNLKLNNPYVKGYNYTGVVAGYNNGVTNGIWIDGANVVGSQYTGGVIGDAYSSISNIIINGNISGYEDVGLIVGKVNSNIADVIADGDVYGSGRRVGGLVGNLNYGNLTGIYRSGSVSSNYNSSNPYVDKVTGSTYSSKIKAIALDSITVTIKGVTTTPSNTNLSSTTGYTVDEEGINSIGINETILDTYIGSDNNNDGYYFDYDENGKMYLYHTSYRPLDVTMSGSGTVDDPYIINNVSELKQASYNPSAHYKLNADIDLNGVNYIMLSSYNNQFTGSLDGNFHSINNFRLIGHEYTGLFGYNSSGTVSNLKLNNSYVKGYNYTGVLTGYNYGVINGLWIDGANVVGSQYTGLLAGSSLEKISNVMLDGNVTGYSYVGLIAGQTGGTITDVIADGNVIASGTHVGGLVGYLGGNLTGIYRSGSVSSKSTSSTPYVSRVIGYNYRGTLKAVSLSSIPITIKGVTTTPTSNDISNNYSGYTVDEEGINSIGINETILDTYIGSDNNNDGYYFDYDENGKMYLYYTSYRPLDVTMSGNGTVDDPYIINNVSELKQASYNTSAHYKLNADIDLDGVNYIMLSSDDNQFTGSFDGSFHSIDNFRLIGHNYTGLFGYNYNGNIYDLRLNNPYVKGYNYTGVLTGYDNGVINGIWIDGATLIGNSYIGLLSGSSRKISNVILDGNVTGYSYVGLIAGQSGGTITDVIADGNVIASSTHVGGLVGYLGGNISAIYRSGSVTSGSSNSNPYVYKSVGYMGTGNNKIIALASIPVTKNGVTTTPSSTNLSSSTGYTMNEEGINSIGINETILDTYIGGDTNADGYYFDYDTDGKMYLYHTSYRPLDVTMSGSGTVDDPYIINSVSDLKQASYNTSAHYKLNADIDLDGINYIMLSSDDNQFTGSFDGSFHSIDNFRLIGHNYTGLFGYNYNGNIYDLRLNNPYVKGYDYSSILCGSIAHSGSKINGIWIDGATLIGNSYVGLLVGNNNGKLSNAVIDGNITGNSCIGLIAGQSGNYVTSIVADGNVIASGTRVGGLAGYLGGNISAVYRSGSVVTTSTSSSPYTNKSIGYFSSGSLKIVALDTIPTIINNNSYDSVSSSISSTIGKSVSYDSLLTQAPYEEVGFNFTDTNSTTNEYIWYFDNGILKFRKN